MSQEIDIFAGNTPFELARTWLAEAEKTEVNDPNAIALASVDDAGMPDVRVVLLKEITDHSFVFYTNYTSAKGQQLIASSKAAFVMHWKSLRRQVRVRGHVQQVSAAVSDAYYHSRALESRLGAWASQQSQPLESRETLMQRLEDAHALHGDAPPRPQHWGGFEIIPTQVEFWHDGAHRLHDRFLWSWGENEAKWAITRLYP